MIDGNLNHGSGMGIFPTAIRPYNVAENLSIRAIVKHI
jgi:hypothetical protein